jgi:hypothetical protein
VPDRDEQAGDVSVDSSPVFVSRPQTETDPSPTTPVTTAFVRQCILGSFFPRSITDLGGAEVVAAGARPSRERAKRVRKVASSIAESPPPTTAMSWSRKKNPSQVAHALTPWPSSFCSPGTFR